jgi:hypothetical protein
MRQLPAIRDGIDSEPISHEVQACDDQSFMKYCAEGIAHHDAQIHSSAFIEEVCQSLFDRWCERRNVVALAYLMHAWPLLVSGPHMVKRLLQSLRELKEHHAESLLGEEHTLLRLILDFE